MRILDKDKWNRKEHFEFFSQFDEPFFGIVTALDCTAAYQYVKKKGHSFFAWYLHKSLLAVNLTEEFKYRIEEDKVLVYDEIHASPTIGREDGTFGFAFVDFTTDFRMFSKQLNTEVRATRDSSGLRVSDNTMRNDLIHYSSIPWSSFSGLTHARNFKVQDSVPKITFGKMYSDRNREFIPVSVNVHHGLADGLHVARFLELFQQLLNENLEV